MFKHDLVISLYIVDSVVGYSSLSKYVASQSLLDRAPNLDSSAHLRKIVAFDLSTSSSSSSEVISCTGSPLMIGDAKMCFQPVNSTAAIFVLNLAR